MTDFAPGTDLNACAQSVERGDPLRFAAGMAAPVEARGVLFALYAFNIEVARAPWVTQEPMIAQMRLQWWADVLSEIATGAEVRRHEVATPLTRLIPADVARDLGRLVEARRRDIDRAPFEDAASFEAYLQDTAGVLAVSAARALGATKGLEPLRHWATATGFVRYLQAVPALEARGKLPLPDGRAEVLQMAAAVHLERLRPMSLRALRKALGAPSGAAALECWQTEPLLRMIKKDPAAVAEDRLRLGEVTSRWRLMTRAW